MGISRISVVSDQQPDYDAMATMATHKARHLIDNLTVFTSVDEAVKELEIIVATTARKGRQRHVGRSPREVVDILLPDLARNRVGIMFGPEDRGLTNDDIKYCQYTSSIPTADFSSLNLAQAVAIHCYELYYAVIHAPKTVPPNPKFASSFELEGMYEHVEEALLTIDFLHDKNHSYWMNNIRQFFARIRLTSKDSQIIRGICRQFLWYQQKK